MSTQKSYLNTRRQKVIIPFGKHAGEYVEDLPEGYIKFLLKATWIESHPTLHEELLRLEEYFDNKEDSHRYDDSDHYL